jgi:anti-sigma regulatory factor (Ser/Thr protein kinase)
MRWDESALYITITDTGAGFYPGTAKTTVPGDNENERGRGLFLMSHLMDDVAFVTVPDGWSVRMTKHRNH